MGGKKRRNTAKTGDTALYNSRSAAAAAEEKNNNRSRNDDDDDMHDEVDRFHNERGRQREEQFIRFQEDGGGGGGEGGSDDDEEEDDGITRGREGVFDLGLGGESSSSSESDSDSSEDESEEGDGTKKKRRRGSDDGGGDSSSSAPSSDSDDSDDDDLNDDLQDAKTKTNVLDWGTRKSSYYHGDTADLEIGQEEEDAEIEEEAGREVVRVRLEGMDEDDFRLDDDDEDDEDDDEDQDGEEDGEGAKHAKKTRSKTRGNQAGKELPSDGGIETILGQNKRRRLLVDKLSKSQRIKLIRSSHPELIPLISHFRDGAVKELVGETDRLVEALLLGGGEGAGADATENAKAVGATQSGLRYLATKAMLQTSTALHVCQYLLLKAESAAARSSGQDGDDGDDLIGSAAMMGDDDNEDDVRNHPVIGRLNQLNDLAERLDADVSEKVPGLREQVDGLVKAAALMGREEGGGDGDGGEGTESDDVDDEDDDDEEEEGEDVDPRARQPMTGAVRAPRRTARSDEESEEDSSSEEEEEGDVQRRVVTEAKFAVRPQDIEAGGPPDGRRKSKSSHKRRLAPPSGDFGDDDDGDEGGAAASAAGKALASTLNAISQRTDARKEKGAMAAAAAPEEEDDENDERFLRGLDMMDAELDGAESGDDDADDVDDELDDGLDGDGFYEKIKKKSKAKKDFKKGMYAVAPKYPVVEEEIEGERSIGRAIMKNRGLVAHKSKMNRNPRVKKREQYRKALIRRKGAVREVRTEEGHKYGGEATGIKSGLSRSRKLGVR